MKTYKNFINGRFTSDSSSHIDVINPATEAVISRVPASSDQEVDAAVAAAAAAQNPWEKLPPIERAGYLRKISALIRDRVEELARIISEEQGKVLPLSRVEVEFTANYIDYMAEWARRIEGEIIPSDRANEHIFLFRKAIGVVAGILPWNFPFFLIARKMAPALVTGNTIVIKPSEETPNNAFEFAKLRAKWRACRPASLILFPASARTVGHRLASHTRRRHDQLHRQRRDRLENHGRCREKHHQGQSGTGRQGSRHRHGRCEHRSRRAGGQSLAHLEQRPGLQLRGAGLRPSQDRR